LLTNALDCGLPEMQFWEMTVGEVGRAIQSKNKIRKIEAQEKASYDYILANLIINGISKVLGGKNRFPTIEEAYPTLFDDVAAKKEETIQEQKMNLSALRFKQFANSYNRNLKNREVANKNE
jgi:hypothetical protein